MLTVLPFPWLVKLLLDSRLNRSQWHCHIHLCAELNGFPNPAPAATAELDNDSTAARQVILQLPWTEAKIHYGDDFTPFTNDDVNGLSVRVTSHPRDRRK